MRDLETNENENRGQVQNLAAQIDERDDIIERLEDEVDELRRKNREMFKQNMR